MSDDERLSLALPCRFEGRVRYFLARMEFTLEDGDLLTDAGGRILCFASSNAALAEAARRFSEPAVMSPDAEELATIRRGLEEMYAPAVTMYELDRAAEWARQPDGSRPDPTVLLEAWRLLAWVGVAPEPARFDPMGFAGMQMSPSADATGRAYHALIETGMKLDGIVRERERRRSRGEALDEQWRDYDVMWTPADAERLAGILIAGLPSLAARLTDAREE